MFDSCARFISWKYQQLQNFWRKSRKFNIYQDPTPTGNDLVQLKLIDMSSQERSEQGVIFAGQTPLGSESLVTCVYIKPIFNLHILVCKKKGQGVGSGTGVGNTFVEVRWRIFLDFQVTWSWFCNQSRKQPQKWHKRMEMAINFFKVF